MSRPLPQDRRDTIVAIATPPGSGALGMIRLSGPDAVAIASGVTRLRGGADLGRAPARVLQRAAIVDPASGVVIDEALMVRMVAPASYTGEDVVELSCHGNPLLLARIVGLLMAQGARLAAPGEFTRRAYLNNRMDLLQAEAVAALIGARSERALELAAREMRGGLSAQVAAVREGLLDLLAGLEVALDFPEDEAGTQRAAAVAEIEALLGSVGRLIEGTRRGRVVGDGLSVMLAGPPNVGKSSLLNALVGRERAIVAPEPGTTRDVIESSIAVAGIRVRLVDGAGLGPARDAIDAEAMRRAREAIEGSDLLLVVVDVSGPVDGAAGEVLELTRDRPRLVVGNKSDLGCDAGVAAMADVVCSALTGAGVAALIARLGRWIEEEVGAGDGGDEGPIVASLRVADQLRQAHEGLARAQKALAAGVGAEAALVDLREVLAEVEELLGLRADEAVLDRIFARFCVGK